MTVHVRQKFVVYIATRLHYDGGFIYSTNQNYCKIFCKIFVKLD